MDGCVYLRDNKWYIYEKLIKCGISYFIKDRNNTYITGEPIRGYYICIIKIPAIYDLHDVDKKIKLHYAETLHINNLDGGTEFYSRDIIDELPIFLQEQYPMCIILNKIEIDDINRK